MTGPSLPRSQEPVFIVGAPRSGTTMLSAMIGSHSLFAVGPESQFFSKLSPQTLEAAISDPEWPTRATRTLMSLTLAEQSVVELFETTHDEVAAFLRKRDPSIRAMLEALTEPFAAKRGKSSWAEKTPNHLLNLETIRQLWPKARVVRIMRDPRDSALSTSNLPAFSSSFVANTLLWRAWQDSAAPFFETDGQTFTIRYESLIEDPDGQLQALCDFLEINYEPDMVEFASAARDVSTANETWKSQVSQKLDPTRMFGWRKSLDEDLKRFASAVNYEYLKRYGYDCDAEPIETKRVFRLSPELVEENEKALVAMALEGMRWLPEENWRKADLVCEPPQYALTKNPYFWARLAKGRLALAMLSKG